MSEQALTKREQGLAPWERSIKAMTERYTEQSYNLLVPQMEMSGIPEGTRLVATQITVDARPNNGHVYATEGGKLALHKAVLNQVAAAVGITWTGGRRVDNIGHPHYCEWQVSGRWLMPDGTVREEQATRCIDLRSDIGDGTPGADAAKIIALAKRKNRDPEPELVQQRSAIMSNAETKAKNRLIRSAAGLQTAYTPAQLNKPFVCCKLAIDPTSALGSRAALANLSGASHALFGPPAESAKVVDASFEEVAPAILAGAQGGDSSALASPPASSSTPPANEGITAPQQALPLEDEASIGSRLKAIYLRAKEHGMDAKAWQVFARTNTGKSDIGELDTDDLELLNAAVEAWVEMGCPQ